MTCSPLTIERIDFYIPKVNAGIARGYTKGIGAAGGSFLQGPPGVSSRITSAVWRPPQSKGRNCVHNPCRRIDRFPALPPPVGPQNTPDIARAIVLGFQANLLLVSL